MIFQGKNAVSWLEGLVVGDVAGLRPGTGTLSVMTNARGGIIDDTVITKLSDDQIYMVLNAGCRDKDLEHLREHLAGAEGVEMQLLDDRSLLALQGPKAAAVLQVRRLRRRGCSKRKGEGPMGSAVRTGGCCCCFRRSPTPRRNPWAPTMWPLLARRW